MNRNCTHLDDNLGLPMPKLIVVHGPAKSNKTMFIELLEQGLRGKTSSYVVMGNLDDAAVNSQKVLNNLRKADLRLVIVETRDPVVMASVVDRAYVEGFRSGLFVPFDGLLNAERLAGVEWVRRRPNMPQELLKDLHKEFSNRHSISDALDVPGDTKQD